MSRDGRGGERHRKGHKETDHRIHRDMNHPDDVKRRRGKRKKGKK